MNGNLVYTDVTLQNYLGTSALIDEGCQCYAAINANLAKGLGLRFVSYETREIKGASSFMSSSKIKGVVAVHMEIAGFRQEVYAYAVPGLAFPLILGNPWKAHNKVRTAPEKRRFYHGRAKRWVKEGKNHEIRRDRGCFTTLAASIASDIEKALKTKEYPTIQELKEKLPPEIRDMAPLFCQREADKLPPHRPGIDHRVDLRPLPDGSLPALPWGPLYGMSKEELLVLRKSLDELLKKGYIRPSNSEAAAPVLFVRKPGGGLRFCCDYRALNAMSKQDRYPLPLIPETLRNLTGARYLTKIDVVAAFNKIRMAAGHENKTAFRTRFGSFEWLVCPFGLSGAPATFQRYINTLLRKYLDDFASAYMDDVIIYSNGSREDHFRKVREVLRALWDGGLFLDPKKSEFAQKRIKYLGFIVHADGKGVGPDEEKVEAIRNWKAPQTQKEVRRFLGFANYYRVFIPNYSKIAAPLTSLTGKGVQFSWKKPQEEAFERLREKYCTAPVLSHWDPALPTFLETDCSGFALGGALIQEKNGIRQPVGFFSQKLNKAEINYDIHDKEMLAVISCLKFWEPELKACGPFTIWTDHKNLEYFMVKRQLSERQIRWYETLAKFQFSLVYRPGTEAILPDALSRREQDTLGEEDKQSRFRRFLEPDCAANWPDPVEEGKVEVTTSSVQLLATQFDPEPLHETMETAGPFQDRQLNGLWQGAVKNDKLYQAVLQAILDGSRTLPSGVRVKVQAGDCAVDSKGYLRHRGKLWVPGAPIVSDSEYNDLEPDLKLNDILRTRIIQSVHDSSVYGHPGRDATSSILARDFYWPLQSKHVRQFLRNCDRCGRNKVWREHKHGLLRPLPVPDQFFQEISMDFMTDLPNSEGNCYLWVIKDRLSKWVVLEAMPTMKAEECARKFMECWGKYHGLPRAITSDRGTNWTSAFWKEFCRLIGVTQRLSSAYHPQTDGGPERINQEVQAYLRNFVNQEQSDWKRWLPTAQLALNGRYHSALGMSPFFATHGYESSSPVALESEPDTQPRLAAIERANQFVSKMKQISDLCQTSMAATAQGQEEHANKTRTPAPIYRRGDKVWLDLRNYGTTQPKKSLSAKHGKYTVAEVLSPVSVRLSGIPSNIHPVFHPNLLRPASQDPLPGQVSDDSQPDPVLMESHEEHFVEEILCARNKARSRGKGREILIKWAGYHEPSWEPIEEFEDNAAMDEFEERYGHPQENDGPREIWEKKKGRGTRRKRGEPPEVTRGLPSSKNNDDSSS
jgi:transposase InsO family protein